MASNDADSYRIRVCAAILRPGDQLLVVRESRKGISLVNLPGGAPQLGETLAHAAIREVREETGYDTLPTEIAYVAERREQRWASSTLEICFYAEIVGQFAPHEEARDYISSVEWLPTDHVDVVRDIPHANLFAASKRGRYIDGASPRERAVV